MAVNPQENPDARATNETGRNNFKLAILTAIRHEWYCGQLREFPCRNLVSMVGPRSSSRLVKKGWQTTVRQDL